MVVNAVCPLVMGLIPRMEVPSKKVTFPVAAGGVTEAVRVTGRPRTDVLAELASVTVAGVDPPAHIPGIQPATAVRAIHGLIRIIMSENKLQLRFQLA